MSITQKRILYLAFFVLFFISAPIVLLYAQGYKFDWQTKRVVKTGVMFLETKPTRAQIYLNNKLQSEKTAARISRLMPREYEVKIAKDGFTPWEKNLTVYPNSTTYAQYIRLFRQTPILKTLSEQKVSKLEYSPDRSLAAFITQKDNQLMLLIYSFSRQQVVDQTALTPVNLAITAIKWHPTAYKLLIELSNQKNSLPAQDKAFLLYDFSQKGKILHINSSLQSDPRIVNFCNFDDSQIYYYLDSRQSTGQLKKYHLITKEDKLVADIKLTDFYLDQNNLYYLEDNAGLTVVAAFSLAEPGKQRLLANLPAADSYKILDIHNGLISVSNQRVSTLDLIQFDQNFSVILHESISNVKNAVWHSNKKILAWWNDFELWVWEIDNPNARKELLTRISSPIEDVFWYPVATHLAYTTANKIRLIELIAHAGTRNTADIFAAKRVTQPFIDHKGDKLYFTGQAGTDEGLFELTIQ